MHRPPVDPRTDVYAMGATLFHMLAGRPPFVADHGDEVFDDALPRPPPPLEEFNPAVSDATCQMVAKALAKAPEDRYCDAGAWLRDLERMLRGEPTQIEVHPEAAYLRPPGRPAVRVPVGARVIASAALAPRVEHGALEPGGWPARPAVHDPSRPDPGVRRFGESPSKSWEEHPFEWVEGRRMGVFREYSRGHFQWLLNEVELVPGPRGVPS